MSSVVNKSKNKFVPKARGRSRPGPTTTPAPSAAPKPLEDITETPTPISTSPAPEEAPVPTSTSTSTLTSTSTSIPTSNNDNVASIPEPTSIPAPVSIPVERQPSPPPPPPRSTAIPMIRSVSGSSAGIPMLRSTSGIPVIVAAGAIPTPSETPMPTPTASVTGAEADEEAGEAEVQEAEVEVAAAPRRPRKTRAKAPAATTTTTTKDPTKDTPSGEEASEIPRPTTKRKARATSTGEPAPKRNSRKPRTPPDPSAPSKPRGRRRAQSPEDGESQEIAINVVKMKDLCKDLRIGRKSARFMEIQAEETARAALSAQERAEADEARRIAEEERGRESADMRMEGAVGERGNKGLNTAQLRIVNGEIVIDDESLQIDRRERDAVDEETLEIVEENQHTRRITSQTFSKREKVPKWDAEQTARFYEALSMFGTDFEIISRMFTGRSRRQMRNKYLCEERKNPGRVTNALRTRISIDINQYATLTSQEFQDPQELEDELQKLRDEHEASETMAASHVVEAERERQEAANAAMIARDSGIGVADTGRKTRKKKGARGHVEEEVLMSREEYEAMRARELAEAEEL